MNQHLKANVSAAPYTTYRVGGTIKTLVEVFDVDGLKRALEINRKFVVLGKGSKVLVSDDGFDGTVILLRSSEIFDTKNGVYAQAGASLIGLSRHYAVNCLTGFEFAVAIPASVGGALKMNAGAHGMDIGGLVVYLDVLREGAVRRIGAADCGFSYRRSGFFKDDIILGACFKAEKGDGETIRQKRTDYIKERLSAQPDGFNCGSVFKNPHGLSAGRLIDQCGFKGVEHNGAQVSGKHANFIINNGRAKARDIYTLVRAMKAEVYTKTDVMLEEELIYVGEF